MAAVSANECAVLISIIVPTYNSEKTISQCIRSVINQTFTDYEILVIDGASRDNTAGIVQSLSEQHHSIRWLSEKDAGIYDAMNKGIGIAAGEWIYFLGSDDTMYSDDTLKHIVSFLNDADVVYGDVVSSRFNGRYGGEFTADKIRERNICHQAIFFRKELFRQIGSFDISYRAHADWDHNLKWFFSKSIRKKYVDVIIANYADGGFSSISEDDSFDKIKEWKFQLLNKSNLSLPAKMVVIKRETLRAMRQGRLRELGYILSRVPSFLS